MLYHFVQNVFNRLRVNACAFGRKNCLATKKTFSRIKYEIIACEQKFHWIKSRNSEAKTDTKKHISHCGGRQACDLSVSFSTNSSISRTFFVSYSETVLWTFLLSRATVNNSFRLRVLFLVRLFFKTKVGWKKAGITHVLCDLVSLQFDQSVSARLVCIIFGLVGFLHGP